MRGFTDETTPHQIAFEAYGVKIRVCASTPEVMARIEPMLPPGHKPTDDVLTAHRMGIVSEDDGTFSVYNSATRVNEGGGLELALVVLDGQIRSYTAVHAPSRIFVHAGAVAHEGRAIVLPGYSFAGKTTLVAALVRAGATYYSDEFAVFDDKGLVHPYAKTLSLRRAEDQLQVEHDVTQLGGVAGDRAVPVGLVVVTYYVPGADWKPRRLTAGQASLALLANTVPARNRPEAVLKMLTRALEGVTTLEGERGEADEVAEQLLESVVETAAD